MARSKPEPISLEEAKARFGAWREGRERGVRIPDQLWSVAVEVAGKEGVSRTATALGLQWSGLKRRVAAEPELQPPAFVELVAPRPEAVPECTLELEDRRGKLRIQLKNASASYVAALSRELLETAS